MDGTFIVITAFVLAVFGIAHLAMDFRHFTDIERQCVAQGYIQNKTTRINCHVEPKTKP